MKPCEPIKKIIDKENISPLCRMCGKWDETIAHIVAECLKFAQKQHKSRKQNKVAIIIYWMLCKKTGCERAEKWYDNKPEGVMWTEKYKLIKTDQTCMLLVDKNESKCFKVDVACPFDARVTKKEYEKLEKYQDLKYEVMKLKHVTIIPIIIGDG